MAGGRYIIGAGFYIALFGTNIVAPPRACASSLSDERAYMSLAYSFPRATLGANYHSYHDDGSDKVKFQDPRDPRADGKSLWLGAGLRFYERLWVGVEHQRQYGDSDGQIGKRFNIGPLSPFVYVPTKEHYRFDLSRLWIGYRLVNEYNTNLTIRVGLTILEAQATATAGTLGKKSEYGILPLPLVGMAWQLSGPWALRYSVSADYGRLKYNGIEGLLGELNVKIEKALGNDFFLGIGYKQSRMRVGVERQKYEADIEYKVSAPFLTIQKIF